MVEPLRHRQTKGAATDMPGLLPPRHIPTLPSCAERENGVSFSSKKSSTERAAISNSFAANATAMPREPT
jgi:hypothetical protein